MKQQEFLKVCEEGNENMVSLSLTQGLNPNFEHKKDTPLNKAIIGNHLQIVKLLIDSGADVNFSSSRKETAILTSAWFGNVEILKILISNGAQPLNQDSVNDSVICRACQHSNAEFVKILLDAGVPINHSPNNWTPLIHSAYKGKTDIVEMLIANGANVNIENQKGQTALMLASQEGKTESVKLLLKAGANINIGVNREHELYGKGFTASPLNAAAYSGHIDIVRMLLAKGAKIETSGQEDGKNALHLSAIEKHYEIVRELIAVGADPNYKDNYGSTIYTLAKENGILDHLEKEIRKDQKEEETVGPEGMDVLKMMNTVILSLEEMSLNKTYRNLEIDEGFFYLIDEANNKKLIIALEEEDGYDFDVYHEDEDKYKKIMLEIFELLKTSTIFKEKGLTNLKLIFSDHTF